MNSFVELKQFVMHRLILLMLLLLLAANGMLAWQNRKKECNKGVADTMATCNLTLKATENGNFILPGALVYIR